MSDQYLRRCSLLLAEGENAMDLSALRIKFTTTQSDLQTPNHAVIRVYNLSADTAQRAQKEFSRVVLQAGYERGNFGTIFDGTIKQVRRGREDPVSTYLDVLAADGDEAYNFGIVNKTLAAGSKPEDQIAAARSAMNLEEGYTPDMTAGALSRGKVMFGMGRTYLSQVGDTNEAQWSIQNGKLQFVKDSGYVPGEAVVVSAETGMVGIPEQTEGGIKVRMLLNPNIKIGTLLQIDNNSINRAFVGGQFLRAEGRTENLPGLLPRVTDDGSYRTYVAEFVGDTRGGDWYVDVTCLAVDRSTSAGSSVKPGV